MQTAVDEAWSGAPLTLAQNEQVIIPQTPNGSVILAWRNTGAQNLGGTLKLTTEGEAQFRDAPPLTTVPSILAQNWGAMDLALSNTSEDASTSIWIQMFGPGIPGVEPIPLPVGTPTMLAPLQTAAGCALMTKMQLVLKSNTSDLTTIAVIGGPMDSLGNNAYLFALNYAGGTAPPGYTAATASNSYTFQFFWGTSAVFITNLSGITSAPMQVLLQSV